MRERLRRERRYSWLELSLAGLGRELSRLAPWRASAAYVTGAHSMKVGYQGTYLSSDRSVHERSEPDLPLQQRRAEPAHPIDLAVDQPLTCRIPRALRPGTVDVRRLTLQGALRFDRATSYLNNRPDRRDSCRRRSSFPRRRASTATRTSRRGWAWYDVFGNGKDRAQAQRRQACLEGVAVQLIYINPNPILRLPRSTGLFQTAGVTRTWIDANGNFAPTAIC